MKFYMLVLYFIALTYIVFFLPRRQELIWHDELINLIPIKNLFLWFQSLKNLSDWREFYNNLLGNIILFIPFSKVVKEVFRLNRKLLIIIIGACASILIEVIQYYWKIGVPDIDDVILNTTGIIIGTFLFKKYEASEHKKVKVIY